MSELNNAIIKNNWSFKDLSDATIKRLRIKFPNGLGISIIQGFGSYGYQEGKYEIGPLDLNEALDGSLLEIDGDDVMGHLSETEVLEKCNEIASIILSPDLICK